LALRTRELDRAREWYTALLGRAPYLEPADGVHDWRPGPGAWPEDPFGNSLSLYEDLSGG
jgi:hypothetical protein